jgi:hypothetical protein
MFEMNPGHRGDRQASMSDIEEKLDAIRREQAELADEIRTAKTESESLSGGFRQFLGGPLADPADVHAAPDSHQP